jgi:SpoVK/Ycf46/Vps4 family AAA+-type ATPase
VNVIAGFREHDLQRRAWVIHPIAPEKLDVVSLLLYGPPGTAKTMMAKALAAELGWPLVILTPSDFLAAGEGAIEARARNVFDAIAKGSRIVYLFDEVDELFLGRHLQTPGKDRSIFTFLTPSFLTKLQDLHDSASQRLFLFVIGTNYVDRIDSAMRRRGRVDREVAVLYPDLESRRAIVREELTKGRGVTPTRRQWTNRVAMATGVFSYVMLQELCGWIRKNWSRPKEVERTIEQIRQTKHPTFRPELEFRAYHGRPDAWAEFARLVALDRGKGADIQEICRRYVSSLPEDARSEVAARVKATLAEVLATASR